MGIQEVLERCPGDFKILESFEIKNNAVRNKAKKKEEKLKKQRLAEKFKKLKAEGKLDTNAKRPKKQKKQPKRQWRDIPLRERLTSIVNSQFARVTYTEAIDILLKAIETGAVQFEEDVTWGMDMGSEHERYLCEVHFQKATIVINYPKDIKAFYMKQNDDDYSWYMALRRYGSVPHSGFGVGFERLVCYTTAIDNIRDVIPFPRYPGHADF